MKRNRFTENQIVNILKENRGEALYQKLEGFEKQVKHLEAKATKLKEQMWNLEELKQALLDITEIWHGKALCVDGGFCEGVETWWIHLVDKGLFPEGTQRFAKMQYEGQRDDQWTIELHVYVETEGQHTYCFENLDRSSASLLTRCWVVYGAVGQRADYFM